MSQGTKPYIVGRALSPFPKDAATSGVVGSGSYRRGRRKGSGWGLARRHSRLPSACLLLFLWIGGRREQGDVDLVDLRVQMPAAPRRLQVKDAVVRERGADPPGVHVRRQDVGAAELSRHEAVAVQALGVPGRHLQQVVHSPHGHLIWGEVAHIQKGLKFALTEPELGGPGPAAPRSRGGPGPHVVAVVEGGGQDLFGQEAWGAEREGESRMRRKALGTRVKRGGQETTTGESPAGVGRRGEKRLRAARTRRLAGGCREEGAELGKGMGVGEGETNGGQKRSRRSPRGAGSRRWSLARTASAPRSEGGGRRARLGWGRRASLGWETARPECSLARSGVEASTVGRPAQNLGGWGVGGRRLHRTFAEALLAQAAGVGEFVLGGGRVGMWHRAA